MAKKMLELGGLGHSAVIHSTNPTSSKPMEKR